MEMGSTSISTIALADSSGTAQTSYSYDPFGNPSSTGATSSNTQQYTGRENDGTGLQYNRARYYSPTLQRFISADPLGFGGGDVNLYAYAGNSPTNFTDPSGNCPLCVVAVAGACVAGGILGGYYGWRIGGRKDIAKGAVLGCAAGTVAAAAAIIAAAAAVEAGATAAVAGTAALVAQKAAQFDWSRASHIFRDAAGHVNPSTAEELDYYVQLFEEVASNPDNYRPNFPLPQGAVSAGVRAFTETLSNGEQVWVYVRQGLIQDAGINPLGAWR